MWPNGKLYRSFTLSASTAEKSVAVSPLATPFSSSTTPSKPSASAEGFQLTSFCHKPSLQPERYLSVQWDLQTLGTNAHLLATSLHTMPNYPSGRFLNNVYSAIVTKTSTDYLAGILSPPAFKKLKVLPALHSPYFK